VGSAPLPGETRPVARSVPADGTPADPDTSRLEQLVGVHATKAGYYAQWCGTRQDLRRALNALGTVSAALCVTTLGPEAVCDAVLDAIGRLADARWAALVLLDDELRSALPEPVIWTSGGGEPVGLPDLPERADAWTDGAAVAVADGGVSGWPPCTRVPMRLDHRLVGVLLVGERTGPGRGAAEAFDVSILQTVANQIVVALRNAWLYDQSEQLRRAAVDGWSEAERRADELARRNSQLRRARGKLAQARRAEVVSRDRNRIARELHDGVAQYLVGIGMHAEWCARHVPADTPLHTRLRASKELARSALDRIRSAVHELSQLDRPGAGLGQALRELASDVRSLGLSDVQVTVRGRREPLPAELEHALFQITQEALWNVVRHAGASRAWVDLEYRTDEVRPSGDLPVPDGPRGRDVRLVVADDGRGRPEVLRAWSTAGHGESGERYGLRNMRSRAEELGGVLEVTPRRGGGVRLLVSVPIGGPTP
jgi:signal transduction histidine kinase